MLTLACLVASLSLDIGKIHPIDSNNPSCRLVRAARSGDFVTVRRCFLDHNREEMDLDSALDAAASRSHIGIVQFLITFGAEDLNSALLSAVARDDVRIAAYLISKDRRSPATNAREAQTLAANIGAFNCDWLLTAHRWDERRSSSEPWL